MELPHLQRLLFALTRDEKRVLMVILLLALLGLAVRHWHRHPGMRPGIREEIPAAPVMPSTSPTPPEAPSVSPLPTPRHRI